MKILLKIFFYSVPFFAMQLVSLYLNWSVDWRLGLAWILCTCSSIVTAEGIKSFSNGAGMASTMLADASKSPFEAVCPECGTQIKNVPLVSTVPIAPLCPHCMKDSTPRFVKMVVTQKEEGQ